MEPMREEGDRIAYVDASHGAAGDMLLAAMIDAGLRLDILCSTLQSLPLPAYRLRTERVMRAFPAVRLHVETHREHRHEQLDQTQTISAAELETMVAASSLPAEPRDQAGRILRRLAAASAATRAAGGELRYDLPDAIDSIVDVVGACVGLHALGARRVFASPLPAGEAVIDTPHGPHRIPSPRAAWIIQSAGVPTSAVPAQVTATAAAILAELAEFREPLMRLERFGYGAGETPAEDNVLRLMVGHAVER